MGFCLSYFSYFSGFTDFLTLGAYLSSTNPAPATHGFLAFYCCSSCAASFLVLQRLPLQNRTVPAFSVFALHLANGSEADRSGFQEPVLLSGWESFLQNSIF